MQVSQEYAFYLSRYLTYVYFYSRPSFASNWPCPPAIPLWFNMLPLCIMLIWLVSLAFIFLQRLILYSNFFSSCIVFCVCIMYFFCLLSLPLFSICFLRHLRSNGVADLFLAELKATSSAWRDVMQISPLDCSYCWHIYFNSCSSSFFCFVL